MDETNAIGNAQVLALSVLAFAMIGWALFPIYWVAKSALSSRRRLHNWSEVRAYWSNPQSIRAVGVMTVVYLAAYFGVWWLLFEIFKRLMPPGWAPES